MAATDVVSENFSELYWKPKYGMEFDSDESVYDFYNAYGSKVGFSIRKETFDNEEQITNRFWADAKMIIDYGQFSDVVSFDTTYKINKENQPFAVFVGLNHHQEIVTFGAVLLYDETADSFIWLFETFLQAMSGKVPKTIFTDQDVAMAKAILNIMPNTCIP
ncbi:hypothetical protein WN943_006633 [Citrus x changshan-huyou]